MGELPPRARRILVKLIAATDPSGTTSACAENTIHGNGTVSGEWNYLRVRGEYSFRSSRPYRAAELPPRARRIPTKF